MSEVDVNSVSRDFNDDFYIRGKTYWSDIPATMDGMLGGYANISVADIQGSRFLLKLIFQSKTPPQRRRVLDCGAGIGRISKNLLIPVFDVVDLVEQNPTFLEQAKELLGPGNVKVGKLYPVGLQDFEPDACKYDVIWNQWVLGHLTDMDLVTFLVKCKVSLVNDGVIVVKENITSSGNLEKDEADSSVTRPYSLFMELFEQAGLHCSIKQKQTNFPKHLYTVYMFVLKPK